MTPTPRPRRREGASQEEADGRYVFGFGEPMASGEPRYSLELEPVIGGGYLVALYERREGEPYPELLPRHKLPVMPIFRHGVALPNVHATREAIDPFREVLLAMIEEESPARSGNG